MSAEQWLAALTGDGAYSAAREEDVLVVTDAETGEAFDVVMIDGSVSIRHPYAVDEMDDAGEVMLLQLMSKLNNRFTCCKQCFDEARNIVTICDIPAQAASAELVRDMVEQVQFIAGITFDLFNVAIERGKVLSDEEIDIAFDTASQAQAA